MVIEFDKLWRATTANYSWCSYCIRRWFEGKSNGFPPWQGYYIPKDRGKILLANNCGWYQCDQCQKQGKISKVISPELESIIVPNSARQQVGVDSCNLPEVDRFKHLIVCIDYFTKWSEAKPLKNKSAPSIEQFLYVAMVAQKFKSTTKGVNL